MWADIYSVGELVLLHEAAFYQLRGGRRGDRRAMRQFQQRSGINPLRVPLIHLPLLSSLVTLLN